MLRKPNTFKKYHDALETQAASSEANSTPRWSIGLKRNVNGNGTFVVTNPENIQLIQPPMNTIGRTLMKFPLTMSESMADELGLTGCLFCVLKYPISALLKKFRRIANDWAVKYLPFSRNKRARIIAWLWITESQREKNAWKISQPTNGLNEKMKSFTIFTYLEFVWVPLFSVMKSISMHSAVWFQPKMWSLWWVEKPKLEYLDQLKAPSFSIT